MYHIGRSNLSMACGVTALTSRQICSFSPLPETRKGESLRVSTGNYSIPELPKSTFVRIGRGRAQLLPAAVVGRARVHSGSVKDDAMKNRRSALSVPPVAPPFYTPRSLKARTPRRPRRAPNLGIPDDEIMFRGGFIRRLSSTEAA